MPVISFHEDDTRPLFPFAQCVVCDVPKKQFRSFLVQTRQVVILDRYLLYFRRKDGIDSSPRHWLLIDEACMVKCNADKTLIKLKPSPSTVVSDPLALMKWSFRPRDSAEGDALLEAFSMFGTAQQSSNHCERPSADEFRAFFELEPDPQRWTLRKIDCVLDALQFLRDAVSEETRSSAALTPRRIDSVAFELPLAKVLFRVAGAALDAYNSAVPMELSRCFDAVHQFRELTDAFANRKRSSCALVPSPCPLEKTNLRQCLRSACFYLSLVRLQDDLWRHGEEKSSVFLCNHIAQEIGKASSVLRGLLVRIVRNPPSSVRATIVERYMTTYRIVEKLTIFAEMESHSDDDQLSKCALEECEKLRLLLDVEITVVERSKVSAVARSIIEAALWRWPPMFAWIHFCRLSTATALWGKKFENQMLQILHDLCVPEEIATRWIQQLNSQRHSLLSEEGSYLLESELVRWFQISDSMHDTVMDVFMVVAFSIVDVFDQSRAPSILSKLSTFGGHEYRFSVLPSPHRIALMLSTKRWRMSPVVQLAWSSINAVVQAADSENCLEADDPCTAVVDVLKSTGCPVHVQQAFVKLLKAPGQLDGGLYAISRVVWWFQFHLAHLFQNQLTQTDN